MTLTVSNIASHITNYFNIGMNIYEPSWDSPGEVLTYTLSKIRIEILDNDYIEAYFDLEHENPMYNTVYSYRDYENKYFFRTRSEAIAKIKADGFELLEDLAIEQKENM